MAAGDGGESMDDKDSLEALLYGDDSSEDEGDYFDAFLNDDGGSQHAEDYFDAFLNDDGASEHTEEEVNHLDALLDDVDAPPSSKHVEEENEAALFGEDLETQPKKRVRAPKRRKKKKKKRGGGGNHRRARKRARIVASSGDEEEEPRAPKAESGDESDTLLSANESEEKEKPKKEEPEEVERTLLVRAHSLVSAYPPTMLFQTMGKSKIQLLLVGDLVRELSCPIHTFSVRTRPESGSSNALFVLDYVKVTMGPITKALAVAEDIAKATGSPHLPTPVISVKVMDLKRAITRSGYFSKATNRPALVAKLLKPLSDAAGKNPITPTMLERYVPSAGNGELQWACRNALATDAFFSMASLVGGRAVPAVGIQKTHWNALMGLPDALDDLSLGDDDLDDDTILGLLHRIHFANPLSSFRADRLHARLDLLKTRKREDKAECIVRAARIFHKLPREGSVGSNDDRYRSAIAWGEPGDVWPVPMQTLLQRAGLFVTQQLSNNRWFACRSETREFFESVQRAVEHGDVRFLRAEEDDDHETCLQGGYIDRMRDAVKVYAPNILLVTQSPARVKYLEDNVSGESSKVMASVKCGPRSIRQGDVVWIDRAHQFDPAELMRIIRMFAEDALTVHVAGSTWACSTSSSDTMFAQLFRQADTDRKETASGTLVEYKAATCRDPMTDPKAPSGVPILITRAKGIVVQDDVRAAFRHARYVTLQELRESNASVLYSGALVLLDDNWTCEDLALVWQCVQAKASAIWFVGGKDWREALQRSSKRASVLSALMTQG